MAVKLIADSGSTKTEWCLIENGKNRKAITQGLSPYFLNGDQIKDIILKELPPLFKASGPDEIFFYGTGCSNPANASLVKKAVSDVLTAKY